MLTWITLGYLGLPLVLFLLGWVRWPLGLGLVGFLIFGLYRVAGAAYESGRREPADGLAGWRPALVAAILLAILCGTGPFGRQLTDWKKHNAILADLTLKPWPVVYSDAPPPPEPGSAALVYYFGYYLPPAAIGKVLGWFAAYAFLFVWSACGLFLVLLWFLRLSVDARARIVPLVVFAFAAGLDPLGSAIRGGGFLSTESWARSWQYPANVYVLLWAPQHALGGWLSTALVMDLGRRGLLAPVAGVILVSAAFWSPFVALGLLPYVAFWSVGQTRALGSGWAAWIASLLVLLILGSFLASLAAPLPHRFAADALAADHGRRYALFIVCEAGVYVTLCAWILRDEPASLALLAVVAGSLLVIPLYRMGIYNDFVMRTSLPSLFALWTICARSLCQPSARSARAWLALALLVGATGPAREYAGAVLRFRVGVPSVASISPVPTVQQAQHPGIARQYVGDRNSFFFRFLARATPGA